MEFEITKTSTTEKSINACSQLLSSVFDKSDKFSPEFLHWLYSQNPNGRVVGTDAYANGSLVAHYATIPVIYQIRGEQVSGVLSLNNVTHQKYQKKGLFTKLAYTTFEEAKRLNYKFIIGVANQNSTYGYLQKFGFELISPLQVKFCIGKLKYTDHSLDYLVSSQWNSKTLSWRLSNPSAKYFLNDNTVISKTEIPGIFAQLHNMDSSPIEKIKLIQKKSYFHIWIGLSNSKKTQSTSFNFPNFLKPSPLNLIFKDLTGDIAPFEKDDIFFELINFDAF